MTTFVLVHGAFRGGWAWDRVRPLLEAAGHQVRTPTLRATATGLDEWVAQVADELADDTVLVGHSQGGVVVREVAVRQAGRIQHLVYLDAAVPDPGERAVDLGPGTPAQLPPRETVVPARPLAAGDDLDEATAAWMNERLAPVPLAPSLDPVSAAVPTAPATYVFCTGTPAAYPCGTTRARLDARATPYALIDAGHDAPLTRPDLVAEHLLAATADRSAAR